MRKNGNEKIDNFFFLKNENEILIKLRLKKLNMKAKWMNVLMKEMIWKILMCLDFGKKCIVDKM